MTRLSVILLIIPALLSGGGCSRQKQSPIADAGAETRADSMLYYFGQISAFEYWRRAASDTSMRSRDSREQYLKGLLDGLNAVDEDRAAYNAGLHEGIRMAQRIIQFNQEYDEDLSPQILYASMDYGLRSDSAVDIAHARKEFYTLLADMNVLKNKEDLEKADMTLRKTATNQGMHRIAPRIYGKTVTSGTGQAVKRGDVIFASVDYRRDDGKDLDFPTPENLTVGTPAMPEVMTEAYCSMRVGEKKTFATTAAALFGTRARQVGLASTDIVIITITITSVEAPGITISR